MEYDKPNAEVSNWPSISIIELSTPQIGVMPMVDKGELFSLPSHGKKKNPEKAAKRGSWRQDLITAGVVAALD